MDDQEANIMLGRIEEEFELDLDDLLDLDKENFTDLIVEFFDELGDKSGKVIEPKQSLVDRFFEIKEDLRDALE